MRTLAHEQRRTHTSMKRSGMVIAAAIALVHCGPDSKPQQQCAGKPDFIVTLSASSGFLPEDTSVLVTFGGDGHERYSPKALSEAQVLFCTPSRVQGVVGEGGAPGSEEQELAGAAGAPSVPATISAITCELWTGGPAWIRVEAAGLQASQALTPKADTCTVWSSIVLDPRKEP